MDFQTYQPHSFDDAAQREQASEQSSTFAPAHQDALAAGGDFAPVALGEEKAAALTDFASIKFQRENTLLTNAERYADSIRGEAELYVSQLQKEIQALNAEAEKRYAEAQQIKEEAEAEAARRLAEAEGRVAEIHAEAHREGFEAGEQQGLSKRYEEAGTVLTHIEEILEDLSRFQKQVHDYMEKDGVRLSLFIAKKILQQELRINKKAVWKLLATTLSGMEGLGQFRIWLSPEDHRFAISARPALEKFIDEEQSLTFRVNPKLPPGNAMIETDREVIDLTLASQFRHLENALYQSLAESEARVTQPPSKSQGAPTDQDTSQPSSSADRMSEQTASATPEHTEHTDDGLLTQDAAAVDPAGADQVAEEPQ